MDSGVVIEWTIRLGDILTMGGALVVAAGLLYRRGFNESDQENIVERLETKVDEMKEELKTLAEVITTQAVTTTRLDNLAEQVASIDRRVEDMRRGNGFVQGRRGAVDGEYP